MSEDGSNLHLIIFFVFVFYHHSYHFYVVPVPGFVAFNNADLYQGILNVLKI